MDTKAIKNSKLLRTVEEASSCRSRGNGGYEPNAKDRSENLHGRLVWIIAYRARGLLNFVCLDVFTKSVKMYALKIATARRCLQI